MALYGRLENDIESEISRRKLDLSAVKKYRLVESRITDTEHGRQKVSNGLFCFVLENIQSEVLCGDPENKRVLSIEERNHYTVLCVCEDGNVRELENKCKEMSYQIREYLGATVSCCLSRACTIAEFHEVREACTRLLDSRVSYYGSVFLQENVTPEDKEESNILNEEELFRYISMNDKMKVMAYLKETLNSRMYDRSLNTNMLYHMSQGILRTVYTYLARKDIRTDEFFVDEEAVALTQKAPQSAMDMLRFASYLVDQTYQYEEHNLSGENNIDRINRFIHEHYMENIGRTEIAAYLHLAPEYVSKLYKKETGNSLTDEITQYRIEKAKLFLQKEDLSIGEVSENCGFENFTYFSTIFKKYNGMTPNQYRKNLKNNS
jgi:two-component system response regulator YesN